MNKRTAAVATENTTPENGVSQIEGETPPARRRPGRPKGSTKAVTEAMKASDGTDPAKKVRRKRRAVTPVDTAAETAKIVEAALKSRGAQGAMQDDLQIIVDWARTVRTEGDALKDFADRPRRQKVESYSERLARYEMNRALLDSVLAGMVILDVQNGAIRFLHAEQGTANTAPMVASLPTE